MDFEAEHYKGRFTGISADVDGNRAVSMGEAFVYVYFNNDASVTNNQGLYDNLVQYYQSSPGLAFRTYL